MSVSLLVDFRVFLGCLKMNICTETTMCVQNMINRWNCFFWLVLDKPNLRWFGQQFRVPNWTFPHFWSLILGISSRIDVGQNSFWTIFWPAISSWLLVNPDQWNVGCELLWGFWFFVMSSNPSTCKIWKMPLSCGWFLGVREPLDLMVVELWVRSSSMTFEILKPSLANHIWSLHPQVRICIFFSWNIFDPCWAMFPMSVGPMAPASLIASPFIEEFTPLSEHFLHSWNGISSAKWCKIENTSSKSYFVRFYTSDWWIRLRPQHFGSEHLWRLIT